MKKSEGRFVGLFSPRGQLCEKGLCSTRGASDTGASLGHRPTGRSGLLPAEEHLEKWESVTFFSQFYREKQKTSDIFYNNPKFGSFGSKITLRYRIIH